MALHFKAVVMWWIVGPGGSSKEVTQKTAGDTSVSLSASGDEHTKR